jgi:hypothetical protein
MGLSNFFFGPHCVFSRTMAEPAQLLRRREKFLPEEDAKLRDLVQLHGTSAWDHVAIQMPGRNPRQCRDRWKHYVSSEKSRFVWTAEEDQLLFEKMQTIGPKWTMLSQFFPGRTDMQVKSRWMQKFASSSGLHLKNKAIPQIYDPQPVHVIGPQMIPAYVFVPTAIPLMQVMPARQCQS